MRPEETVNNPLLSQNELPLFEKINPQHILPAIEKILQESRESIKKLESLKDADWNNLVQPLELIDDRINQCWSPVRHLNSVKSSDELREAYTSCLPLLSEYSTEVSQNRNLFNAYQKIAENPRQFDNTPPPTQVTPSALP